MKYFVAVLVLLLSLAARTAGAADTIALTATYKVPTGSGSGVQELGLSQRSLFQLAKKSLESKGWKVVPSAALAGDGLEALIQVTAVQNASGSDSNGYAVGIGLFGVSNGTSDASNGKRLAFAYGNSLIAYGGPSAARNTRLNVAATIEEFLAETFPAR
jgi:hypothetical protein